MCTCDINAIEIVCWILCCQFQQPSRWTAPNVQHVDSVFKERQRKVLFHQVATNELKSKMVWSLWCLSSFSLGYLPSKLLFQEKVLLLRTEIQQEIMYNMAF